ncbi:MAG: hypothetical protein V1668_04245 [Patescibacteria group bacterium]
MREEKYRPFVVTAFAGCALWTFSGGFVHAYMACPDWEIMGAKTAEAIIGWQPFIALVITGFILGLSVETAKFIGGIFRSSGAVIFLPMVAGALIGMLQGYAVTTTMWGFSPDMIFRDENTRLFGGAGIGLILSPLMIIISIAIRRKSKPW